jgi:hypothetical protein
MPRIASYTLNAAMISESTSKRLTEGKWLLSTLQDLSTALSRRPWLGRKERIWTKMKIKMKTSRMRKDESRIGRHN